MVLQEDGNVISESTRIKNVDKKLDRERRRVVLKSRDFKNRGRGGSETRPEVIFLISDEEHMRVAYSPALENAAWRDLASFGKRE